MIILRKNFIIIVGLTLYVSSTFSFSAITFKQPPGRLGDQLFCYVKAKWISYEYGLPLYYEKFKYSDELFLSKLDHEYVNSELSGLVSKKNIQTNRLNGSAGYSEINPDNFIYYDCDSVFNKKNTLFIIDQFFFPLVWKHLVYDDSRVIHPYDISYSREYSEQGKNKYQMRHDEMIFAFKHNHAFIEELRRVIKPINKIHDIQKPQGMISVAVHVRVGGGFDARPASPFFYETQPQLDRYVEFIQGNNRRPYYSQQQKLRDTIVVKKPLPVETPSLSLDLLRPLKHVPMQFYVDQIKGLAAIFKNRGLFVYIFTDEPDPENIKNKFEQLIGNKNILFACRKIGNHYNANVLEDLFAMSKFDCLVRPYSSLSHIAELIGSHKIVISPRHGIWHDGNLIIDEVSIMTYDHNFVEKWS